MNDGKEIALLDWSDGKLKYKGKIDNAAKIFLNTLKPYVDQYIEQKLKEEYEKICIIEENEDITEGLN